MNAANNILKAFLLLSLITLAACSEIGGKDDALDESVIRKLVNEKFYGLEGLQEAVSQLYVSVINKEWASVYRFRDESIQRLVDEETFVATMSDKMTDFSLRRLVFQLIEATKDPSGDIISCRVVMRVVQDPYAREHTAVVNWSKESGDWKCDSIGLRGSSLLGPW